MAHGPQLSRLQVLDAIRSPTTRRKTLHDLKHVILGHDEQQAKYVETGLVDLLLSILGEELAYRQTRSRQTPEADVEIDTVIILGSLARGGSIFLNTNQLERLVPLLLDLLDSQSSQTSLLEASLRTLNCVLSLPTAGQNSDIISILQNHPSTLRVISHVLDSPPSGRDFASYQATLLLPKTCTPGDGRWQDSIIECGILAGLIKRLAKLVKAVEISRIGKGDGFLRTDRLAVLEQNSLSKSSSSISLRHQPRDPGRMPDILPASEYIRMPPASSIAALLDAIAFTIRGSKFRSDQLLFASAITDILGEDAPPEAQKPSPLWRDSKTSDEQGDNLTGGYHFAGQDFPPLSPNSDRHNRATSSGNSLNPNSSLVIENSLDHERSKIPQISHLRFTGETENDPESTLIQWLITYIRQERDSLARLTAISLLTDLVQAGCVSKRKVKKLGQLVVPLLVRLLDEVDTSTVAITKVYDQSFQAQEVDWLIREQAPAILATLLTDNQRLQTAAVEAGAIKRLTGMLKRAFDAIPSPSESDDSIVESQENLWKEKVRAHQIKVREGTLRALAAIALFEDDHRKKIIDSHALGFVVGSLTPGYTPENSRVAEDTDLVMSGTQEQGPGASQLTTIAENDTGATFTVPETSRIGNPVSVLIAATNVVRSLSRSVNVLSTSLIDWHVSEPLFNLLSHPSIQVQIAATAALCNLVMEFSPLRKNLEERGIVKALGDLVKFDEGNVCSYDQQGNSIGEFDSNREALRLNAIWALKHLVLKQDEPVILSCLSAFGTNWLLEQVAIEDCTPKNEASSVIDHSEEGRRRLESHNIEFSPKTIDRLAMSYQAPNPEEQRRKALVEFQEQALDFFRNIMAGPSASSTFKQILKDTRIENSSQGSPQNIKRSHLGPTETPFRHRERFYDVLTEKLKSQPGEKIVLAIIYVLVHIGACAEHRAKLIEQSSLFHELIKLFDVQADQIRIGLSWLAINLTWKENGGSNGDFLFRVQKLREYRYVERLEWLKRGGVSESDDAAKSGSSQSFGEGPVVGMGDHGSSFRDPEGEHIRTSTPTINMSLDLRERCRQALAQINDL